MVKQLFQEYEDIGEVLHPLWRSTL